jgi:hydroxymethylpyrimidine pyrophosphatase-like HAD family hydrolase
MREPFQPGVARGIVDLLRGLELEIRLTIELEGWEFGSNRVLEQEQLWRINSATPDMVMTVDEALAREPVKIWASRPGDAVSDLVAVVSQQFGEVASVIPVSDMSFMNIVSIRTSKSEALRKLLLSRDILLEDVLAFGDDVPDIDLLAACGIPVAMANSVPEVRAVTCYTTASNDGDGVAIVLEKMLEAGADQA